MAYDNEDGASEIEALATRFATPAVLKVNGREVLATPPDWHHNGAIDPPQWEVKPLLCSTLESLVNYIETVDDAESDLILHVESERAVVLYGALEEEEKRFRRSIYVRATVPESAFLFDRYQDHEQFIVGLQTMFSASGDRPALLQFLGTIVDESSVTVADDGVSQVVATQAGLRPKVPGSPPSPANLQPFRTFREIQQPFSPYIVRLARGTPKPKVGLFVADGDSWRPSTINTIAEYLRSRVKVKVIA